ncbi:MAG: PIN domain-containing protein [Verrucomicrobia bacterium]|nr:PIN domain-containing protein [Verrucomicrobiota bacterium]
MANLVIPDSNVFINATRAGLDPFVEFGAHADEWEFATCGMVVLEVTRGLRIPKILLSFQERFAIMIYVPTTNQIWERTAQLAWTLDRQGVILPAQDILIAAHALQTDAAVLTHDAHFRSIPGLRVINRLS